MLAYLLLALLCKTPRISFFPKTDSLGGHYILDYLNQICVSLKEEMFNEKVRCLLDIILRKVFFEFGFSCLFLILPLIFKKKKKKKTQGIHHKIA